MTAPRPSRAPQDAQAPSSAPGVGSAPGSDSRGDIGARGLAWFLARTPPLNSAIPRDANAWNRLSVAAFIARHSPKESPVGESTHPVPDRTPQDLPPSMLEPVDGSFLDGVEFDGCARECRKAGTHTHVWGRCAEAPEPTPPSKDDLRGLLIAARLASHVQTMDDGIPSVVMHSDEEAADRALAVFQEWMFGAPEEIAARKAEADTRTPDDTVRLCEMARPGEHARRVLTAAADQLDAMPETDGAALKGPYWYRDGWKQATGMLRDWADYPTALAARIARGGA